MQLTIKNIDTHLKKDLLPIYLITSDEPLLAESARNKIIQAAEKRGFSERQIMHVEPGFHWDQFSSAIHNGSLFNPNILIDLRNQQAKFDAQALKEIKGLTDNPSAQCLVIITTQKLSAAQKKSKWYQLIEKNGATLMIWSLSANEYPQWIAQQAKAKGLQIDHDASALLADTVEGNLFAAAQAIEKCTLLCPNEPVTIEKMRLVISDSAQFTVFDLVNALLLGNVKKANRILQSLQQTGTEAVLVLWAITREVRDLLNMRYQRKKGQSAQQILSTVWSSKKTMVQTALKRLSIEKLEAALTLAESIDMVIKGQQSGNTWLHLQDLCLLLCGQSTLQQANQ